MLSNISDLFTMASLVICMLLSGIIFYYLRTRISMLEQSVMDQAQLLQQVVTSLKSTQYRQQQMNVNANANANTNVIYAQQHEDVVNSSQMQMNLIQVSDDSDGDSDNSDHSDSDNSDDSHNSESDDDESGNVCTLEDGSCKIIDLSTISSSTNYLRPSSHSEIKVIELKSNIRSNKDYVDNSDNSSDEDDNDDEDDEEDDDEDDDEDDEDDEECSDRDKMNDDMNCRKNDDRNENYIKNKNHDNVNIKKMKSIVIENLTNSVSLDEMKNMPVNSLRSLAKTKLSNIDIPTINKMSKKEILKALHE
jgi:hypothetical protein